MSYLLKERIAEAGNYGGSRPASQIKYLVIHYTGNDGDTAEGNGSYFANNRVSASAHYFVDDDTVVRSVPDLRIAWAVGGRLWADTADTGGGTLYGTVTNANSISVELCDTEEDGSYRPSDATLDNAVSLCRALMRKYDIPIERVCRHFDVTGKYCPVYFMDSVKWAAFKSRLEDKSMDNTPAMYAAEAVAWAQENGILRGDDTGDLKLSEPLTRQQFIAMLHRYHLWLTGRMSNL